MPWRPSALYDEILTGVEGVQTPVTYPGNHHVYNQYTLKAERQVTEVGEAVRAFYA